MFLKEIMGIGSLDLQYIEENHAVIEDVFDGSTLRESPLDQVNTNTILTEIFT